LLRQWKVTGTYEARRQGGDRRSALIEAHAAELVALVETTPDITLAEIARGARQTLRSKRSLALLRSAQRYL
jgi:hypothetical protein